ncbi:hypothetical protein MMC18_000405 [Xylographa bjoerkii]|nr:hypothetical protein [Xylographa bjoerkii]
MSRTTLTAIAIQLNACWHHIRHLPLPDQFKLAQFVWLRSCAYHLARVSVLLGKPVTAHGWAMWRHLSRRCKLVTRVRGFFVTTEEVAAMMVTLKCQASDLEMLLEAVREWMARK